MVDILKLRKLEQQKKEKEQSDKKEDKTEKKEENKPEKETPDKIEESSENKEYEVVDNSKEAETDREEADSKSEVKANNDDDDPAEKLRQQLLKELEEEHEAEKNMDKEKSEVKNDSSKPDNDSSNQSDFSEEIKNALDNNDEFNLSDERVKLENVVQVIGFFIGKECYGIEIKDIKEIIRMVDITKVPNVPGYIEGAINLRGNVVPVVNLRLKVNMERIEFNQDTRIIIIENDRLTVGFIVDKIDEVRRIPEDMLEPPPEITIGDKAEYIRSVARTDSGMVILLDTQKLLEREGF